MVIKKSKLNYKSKDKEVEIINIYGKDKLKRPDTNIKLNLVGGKVSGDGVRGVGRKQ